MELDKMAEKPKENKQLALDMSSQAIQVSSYKNEQNLMKFPFCSTSKKTRFTPIVYESEGFKLQVTGSNEYGIAKIFDFDIIKFAISKIAEIKKTTNILLCEIVFSAYECIKAIGKDPKSGKNLKTFREALDRLSTTSYKTNIYGSGSKKTANFTLVKYEYVETSRGIDKVKLVFDKRFIESFVDGSNNLLLLDSEVIREGSGLKKRLIELVRVNLNESTDPYWEVAISELQQLCANEWVLKKFKYEISTFQLSWKTDFYQKVNQVFVRFSEIES
jgi:hypothetical protein